LISVIIVNYNTCELILKLIESFKRFEKNDLYEIIVVDNDSSDNSHKIIMNSFPKVNFIKNLSNVGFGSGNNIGVGAALGEYVLFLNSDTRLKGNILKQCLETCQKLGSVILGCRLNNPDGTEQASVGKFPRLKDYFYDIFRSTQYSESSRLKYQSQTAEGGGKVDWITGAFMFMEKKKFISLGGFDEKIFMYGEDIEFCLRAGQSGISCYFIPGISIMHVSVGSSQSEMKLVQITDEGRLKYWAISHGPQSAILLRLIFILRSCIRILLFSFLIPVIPGLKNKVHVHLSALSFLISGRKIP